MAIMKRVAAFLILSSLIYILPVSSEFVRAGRRGSAVAVPRRLLQVANPACPLDFSFLTKYRWIKDACADGAESGPCCTAALSGMGMSMAKYLNDTGYFNLPDLTTSEICLDNFRIALQQIGVKQDIVGQCFLQQPTPNNYSTAQFVYNPQECQGIKTADDFRRVQNATGATDVDSPCEPTLVSGQCGLCIKSMWSTIAKMTTLNSTAGLDCFDSVVVYVAGQINVNGPWEANTARCLFGVTQKEGSDSIRKSLILGLVVSISVIGILIFCGVGYGVWQHRKETLIHRDFVLRNNTLLHSSGSSLTWFKWTDIKSATRNFAPDTMLGEGSYGSVYKATFKDGRTLAVKQFRNCTPEGDWDFLNEVETLCKLKHKNLVTLQGCCIASSKRAGHQRLLVYDYFSNHSLADNLFNTSKPILTWPQRERIAIGMAQGLAYLHSDAKPQTIHRDIKTNNILLDDHLEAHVADFGLAKFASEEESMRTSHIRGTLGHVAPEYALYGQLTEKSDVYSFGVCLLELLSGRHALLLDEGSQDCSEFPVMAESFITEWTWSIVEKTSILDVIDQRIRNDSNQHVSATMERFVMVGMMCAHVMVSVRPTMKEVLRMLEGHCEIPYERVLERPLLPLSCKPLDLEGLSRYEALEVPSDVKPLMSPS